MAQVQLTASMAAINWDARARPAYTLRALVWRRFRKHKPAVVGLMVLAVVVIGCLVVPWAVAYDAGTTHVEIIRQPPSAAHIFGTDELARSPRRFPCKCFRAAICC
ncbi:MAG: hypothetical protein HYR71_05825 [Chloroflexi bacterium]|nr:hypothetical protein [Chloroflexota bacterium]